MSRTGVQRFSRIVQIFIGILAIGRLSSARTAAGVNRVPSAVILKSTFSSQGSRKNSNFLILRHP